MKIAVIKKLNERLPYWVKRPFAPVIHRRLTENRVFLDQYRALAEADAMTEEEKRLKQTQLLQQTIRHAYDHTVYYKNLFDSLALKPADIQTPEDLEKLPVLTKELLKENYEKLQADDINDFYDVRTGGTTGEPTHVLMEKDAIYREWAFTYHYWSKYGYDFRTSRLATLRGVDLHGKLYEINPLYNEIRLNVFRLNRDNIQDYIQQIDRYGADFIYGYPSAVYNLCRLARQAGIQLEHRFKAALLISENLYDFQESEIKSVLASPIAVFYGHSERAVYAERYEKGYVFQPLYGVTEIGEDGAPIVTGFINGKTPLIRYLVDDCVEPAGEEAAAITGHRDSDVVRGANGEQFRASALNFHGAISSKFPWFQFIQEVPGELTLLVPTGYASQQELDRLCMELDRRTAGALHIRAEFVEAPAERGKYKMLVHRYRGVTRSEAYRIIGHWSADLLEGRNGEQISAAAINFHDGTFEGVEKYQFVQEQPGSCVLNVVPSKAGLPEGRAAAIERSVNQKLGRALQCRVRVTETLAATESGKYKMVVQRHRGGVTRSEAYCIIGHRDREVLLGARGEQISVAAINFHDSTFNAVAGYQFVQTEPGRCILNVVPAAGSLTGKEQQRIAKSVAAKLAPAIVCEIRPCRELTLTQRGKYKMVLQNCSAAPEAGGVHCNTIDWAVVCRSARKREAA